MSGLVATVATAKVEVFGIVGAVLGYISLLAFAFGAVFVLFGLHARKLRTKLYNMDLERWERQVREHVRDELEAAYDTKLKEAIEHKMAELSAARAPEQVPSPPSPPLLVVEPIGPDRLSSATRPGELRGHIQTQHIGDGSVGIQAHSINIAHEKEPRRITINQRTRLVDLLKSAPGNVQVQTPVGDSESNMYAIDIADALRAAGWNLEWAGANGSDRHPTTRPTMIMRTPPPIGVILTHNAPVTPDPDHPGLFLVESKDIPPYAMRLHFALSSIGIGVQFDKQPDTPDDLPNLIVGHRK